MPKKRRLKRPKWLNGFAFAGLYFLIVAVGLIYGLFRLDVRQAPPGAADTVWISQETLQANAYHRGARSIMTPFLEQAARAARTDLSQMDPAMLDLTDTTRDRLLRLTVPASAREVHLAFILLLDRWNRALRGSAEDAALVAEETDSLIDANAWLAVSRD